MEPINKKKYDIIAVGELLIDFISTDFAENLDEAVNFKRLQGGSPANMCMNLARLGHRTVLVAAVGNDDMGLFLRKSVEQVGVDSHYIKVTEVPTTLILVTRSKEVSNFEAYRMADIKITDEQIPSALFGDTSIYHTTCFAMSKEPARGAILRGARLASQKGCQLSIDANYARKIWTNQQEAQETVAEYCKFGALVKVSEVDWERLYNTKLEDPSAAARHFLQLGAREVCITMGGEGCFVANTSESHFIEARAVEVKDTTGAGDAFWSGYLAAYLDGYRLKDKAMAGRRMAELKLAHFGPLPLKMNKQQLYEDFY
jgi:fructokinase